MKKTKSIGKIIFVLTTVLFGFCTKYRDIPNKYVSVPPPAGTIAAGTLKINEFICKGTDSPSQTYLGTDAKWFELYNPTTQDVILTAGHWYVTDTLGQPTKFAILSDTSGKKCKVPALGFLVIICPKSTSVHSPNHINSSFSLSSTAGDIGIYYQATTSSPLIAVDHISYNFGSAGANSGKSYGCSPDGQGSPVVPLPSVTCETSNPH